MTGPDPRAVAQLRADQQRIEQVRRDQAAREEERARSERESAAKARNAENERNHMLRIQAEERARSERESAAKARNAENERAHMAKVEEMKARALSDAKDKANAARQAIAANQPRPEASRDPRSNRQVTPTFPNRAPNSRPGATF